MQFRTYGDLFKSIQSLAGVGTFAPSEKDDIANFINRRFFEAFQTSSFWPRYLVVGEERTLSELPPQSIPYTVPFVAGGRFSLITVTGASADIYNAQYVYNPNNNRYVHQQYQNYYFYFEGGFWKLHYAGNVLVSSGDQTSPATATWTGALASSVIITQGGNVGEFIRIHETQPFLNSSALELDFYVDVFGAHILNRPTSTDSTVFVTYKTEFVPLAGVADYELSNSAIIPAEFFYFISHAAYADFLRMDGQTDKALAEEQAANQYLALELEKINLTRNNNVINRRFLTHGNRQSR